VIPSGPADVLRREHEVILRALALAERVADALDTGPPRAAAGAADGPVLLPWLLDFFETYMDGWHHAREEQLVFPTLAGAGLPHHGPLLATLRSEHDGGRALLAEMRAGGPTLVGALQAFAVLVRAHIQVETETLLPLLESRPGGADLGGAFAAVDAAPSDAARARLLAELRQWEEAWPERRGPAPGDARLDTR
jgi:hemerythrin-like domain-containing protein